jgi:hypothetical protein
MEYYVSETGCASVFRQRTAPNLADPFGAAILRYWANDDGMNPTKQNYFEAEVLLTTFYRHR